MCRRTWSWEAPAKSARVVRVIGPWICSGRRSPTRAVSASTWALSIAHHRHHAHLGAKLAGLVHRAGVLDDELEGPAALLVDVARRRGQRQPVAGVDRPVEGETLLAVQNPAHVHADAAFRVEHLAPLRRRGQGEVLYTSPSPRDRQK